MHLSSDSHDHDDWNNGAFDAEFYEDITATALRLRDLLDDLCTEPIPTMEHARELGLRFRLLGSLFHDVGNALIDGEPALPH